MAKLGRIAAQLSAPPRREVLLAVCGLIGVIALAGCARDEDPRPNVLLFVLEGVRADHLGSYGYRRRATSPHVDEVAKSSLRFRWAYATAAKTAPSVASILTGLDPAGHGLRDGDQAIASEIETLAEGFHAAGFATGAVVGAGALTARAGFARGFDSFEPGGDALALIDRLDAAGTPWFAFVHQGTGAVRDGTDPELYDERVAAADSTLGRLRGRLRDLQIDEGTLLLVTADRGEPLGERDPSAVWTLHEEGIHVPLLLRPPQGIEPRAIGERVSLLSIAPTLLELAGIEHEPHRFRGQTLSEWLFGDPANPRTPPVFSELGSQRAAIDGRYKLILDDETGEGWVYDLAADPNERRDIAAGRPQLRARLEQLIERRANIRRGAPEPARN